MGNFLLLTNKIIAHPKNPCIICLMQGFFYCFLYVAVLMFWLQLFNFFVWLIISMTLQFDELLRRPAAAVDGELWAFIVLPKAISDTLPRRGRTTVEVRLKGKTFLVTLEPDGRLSHWMRISKDLLEAAGVAIGERVSFEITPVAQEPEPELPRDLQDALLAVPEALAAWKETTTLARLDWIHWLDSAKQTKTRIKRINDACDMLAAGKRRVCCFDTSGFYSKALAAPQEAD